MACLRDYRAFFERHLLGNTENSPDVLSRTLSDRVYFLCQRSCDFGVVCFCKRKRESFRTSLTQNHCARLARRSFQLSCQLYGSVFVCGRKCVGAFPDSVNCEHYGGLGAGCNFVQGKNETPANRRTYCRNCIGGAFENLVCVKAETQVVSAFLRFL